MRGKRLIEMLWVGVLLQVAGQLFDLAWHARNEGFESAEAQIPVHGPFVAGLVVTFVVGAVAIARRSGSPERIPHLAVAWASAATIAAAVWHGFEHARGGEHPELAGALMFVLWVVLLAAVVAATLMWRRAARRDHDRHEPPTSLRGVSIGHELPDAAVALLGAEDMRAAIGKVVIVATVDDAGFPHVALLSPGEMLALSSTHVRTALNAGAKTIRNIADRSKVTLIVIEPEICCYVKGRATVGDEVLPETSLMPFRARRVDIDVEAVLLDAEAGASIVTGPRYERAASLEDELAHWRKIHAFLDGR